MANNRELLESIWDSDINVGKKLLGTFLYILTKWWGWLWIIGLIFIIGEIFSGDDSNTKLSSIEDAQKYISGKTFVGTPSNDIWYKIEFTGNSVSLWRAMPSDGRWSKQVSSSYTVEQDRYYNDGKTYFYVMSGDYDKPLSHYQFDITGKRLYLNIGDRTGTPMREGDRNPWN
jgi:hypothetical protein